MKDLNKKSEKRTPIAVCSDMKDHLNVAGEFITQQQAIDSLNAYFDLPDTPSPDDPKHIYGHTYGLDTLKMLLANFDQYNQNKPMKLIKGVRLYYGVSQRHDKYFPLNPVDGFFRDLFFMPVNEDGDDVFPVELAQDKMILGGPRPCPNECGFSFIDKI